MEQKKTVTDPYRKFHKGSWTKTIDVRDFIAQNYTPYSGDEHFLAKPTRNTQKVWKRVKKILKKEFKKGGVLGIDTKIASTITSHKPGYIDRKRESIVGIQTEKPLIRAIKPRGGIRLVEKTCEKFGCHIDPKIHDIFTNYVTTHNDGVFEMYANWDEFKTPDGKSFRSEEIITGLPDNYSRGRIIGDYRRVPLYGVDRLIAQWKKDEQSLYGEYMNEENMRGRMYVHKHIQALSDMKKMADFYGFDISLPATDTKEAIQWLYFAYLSAVKEQDGAAMSMGRIDAFLDMYAERDLAEKKYTEEEIQQFIDDFVIKLRIVRHLRHPEYNALFAGDPTWVTCSIGGMAEEGNGRVRNDGTIAPLRKKLKLKPPRTL
ncbi:hypothetical protein HZA41_02645 [Candidatus Peregrinibacteria bacterium]|nr:hypothetical protein [Candidatus Peregrinibacteria bacterium]